MIRDLLPEVVRPGLLQVQPGAERVAAAADEQLHGSVRVELLPSVSKRVEDIRLDVAVEVDLPCRALSGRFEAVLLLPTAVREQRLRHDQSSWNCSRYGVASS